MAAALALWAAAAWAGPPDNTPTRQEVQAAVARLKADPDMATTGREKKLRFKDRDKEDKKAEEPAGEDLRWLRDFFKWFAGAARVFIWLAAAVAVAFLLVGLRRWVRTRAEARMPARSGLPSHVRSLDIRPESLPDAIGAAAAALWRQGEHLAALSLLYRGALSRLVHVHAVPIRAASTEGECVSLAQARLDAPRGAFVGQLVGAWQLAVYGARLPDGEQVLALCRDFDLHLRAAAPAAP